MFRLGWVHVSKKPTKYLNNKLYLIVYIKVRNKIGVRLVSLVFAIAIYFVCWWTILFAVLPIGVRTQDEEGDVVPGSVGSAPAKPQMGYKVFLTTCITTVVFAIIYVVMNYDLIRLEDIPFFQGYDKIL